VVEKPRFKVLRGNRYFLARLVIAVLMVLLYVAFVIATFREVRKGDWIHHGYDGTPAPCPGGKGYWPRDCH
jgi:hypothetical protein